MAGSTMTPLRWPGMGADGVTSAVAYDGELPQGRWHRGVPGTSLTVIVGTGDPVPIGGGTTTAPDVRQRLTSLVGGLQHHAAWTREEGRSRGVHLSISPLAARRLVGCPAAELAPGPAGHTTVGLDTLLGRAAEELQEALAGVGASEQSHVLREWVRRRPAGRGGTPRPEVTHAWRLATTSGGRPSVAALAREVRLSERQLRTLVRRELGVGPGQVLRLARFERARARVVAGIDASLADTAAECGYADHSHLDRDWRELIGCSPTAWLAEERRNVQAVAPEEPRD